MAAQHGAWPAASRPHAGKGGGNWQQQTQGNGGKGGNWRSWQKGQNPGVAVVPPVGAGAAKYNIPTAPASPAAKEGLTLSVTTLLNSEDIVVRTLVGTYADQGENHGRRYWLKQEKIPDYDDLHVYLYYWDQRDGDEFSGWWFGDAIGGTQVFAKISSAAMTPPRVGWRIPWDAEKVEPGGLIVEPKRQASAIQKAAAPTPATPAPAPAAKGDEWEARVKTTATNVEEVVEGAKEMLGVAKQITAGNYAEANADDVVQALQEHHETVKQTLEFVNTEMTQAKSEGPASAAAVQALARLIPKLKSLNAMIGIEMKNVKEPAPAPAVQATPAVPNIKKEKAILEKAAVAAAVNATKDIDTLISKAVELIAVVENSLEDISSKAQPLLNSEKLDATSSVDAGEIEKLAAQAAKQMTDAGRGTNLALQAVRRAGSRDEHNKTNIEELTNLQLKLTEAQQKLAPFKTFKADLDAKIKLKLKIEQDAREKEMRIEKEAREKELRIEKEAREKELRIEKEKREKELVPTYVPEMVNLIKQIDDAIEVANDAELPFLSGMEVLPVQEATETLANCDKAVAECANLVNKARSFGSAKATDMKKFTIPEAKPAIEELTKLLEKVKTYSDKLTKLKKDIAEHRRNAQVHEIEEALPGAEKLVEEVSAAVKPFEEKCSSEGTSGVLPEDATGLSEKVVEIQAAAKSKLDAVQKLVSARQKDSEKVEGEAEIMKSVDGRLKKASAELARSSKIVAESTQVVTARKVLAEAKASAKALEVEVAATTDACAPLAGDGGKKFLVSASADKIVEAFQQVMSKDAVPIDELFNQVGGGKPKISSGSFVKFVSSLPDNLGREDLRLDESRVLAVYKMFDASESDGISVETFKALFLNKQYQVCKKIALTDNCCLSEGKTLCKLEAGELVEVIGETKRDEATGITRVQCRVISRDESGWVTSHGSAGGVFLQAVSAYTIFVEETTKKIDETIQTAASSMALIRSKLAEVGNATEGPLKETKAELMKMKPKAVETQSRLEKLKRSFAAQQKEFKKVEDAEKNAHLEAKEREEKDAILALACKKAEALMAAVDEMEAAAKPLLSRGSDDQLQFETPVAVQDQTDRAGLAVASAAAEIEEYTKDSLAKVSVNALGKGPLAEAKQELTKLREKAVAALSKREATIQAVGSACKAIADAGRSKVTKALREEAQSTGVSVDSLFSKLAGGKAELSMEELCTHLASLNGADMNSDHLKLSCRAIQIGSISKRRFIETLQSYYVVVKEVALTPEFEVSKSKPIRKAEANEIFELIEGPRASETMSRVKVRSLKDNLEAWITVSGNKGTPFLKETVKPYYACSRDVALQKNANDNDAEVVRTLRSEEILEVIEGPKKSDGEVADELRGRIKVPNSTVQGFVTVRDCSGTVFIEASDKHFVVQAATPITEELDPEKGTTFRKLAAGELFVALDDPVDVDGTNVKRVNAKAAKDGVTGWVSITGAKVGTVYSAPSKRHYVVRNQVSVYKRAAGQGDVVKCLEEGEIVEMLGVPKSEKVEVPVRMRCRALTDESVGWISVGGARRCKPHLTCRTATPIHDSSSTVGASVIRQLDVNEVVEMLEVPQDDTSDAKILRFRGCAVKDGVVGWMTIKDGTSTYITAADAC